MWHNYGFDRHVMANMGVECRGFAADTMHMARLHDASRKLRGGYSLEGLSSDKKVRQTRARCFAASHHIAHISKSISCGSADASARCPY